MGYARIEPLAGGATFLIRQTRRMKREMTDARANMARERIIAEVGAGEDLNRLWSSPQQKVEEK